MGDHDADDQAAGLRSYAMNGLAEPLAELAARPANRVKEGRKLLELPFDRLLTFGADLAKGGIAGEEQQIRAQPVTGLEPPFQGVPSEGER